MNEIIIQIESLLREKFRSRVKTFFIGNPSLLSESSLPCIAIEPTSTAIDIADTGRDRLDCTFDIILIANAKHEISGKIGQTVGTTFLIDLMEGVDDNALKQDTILNVIRSNLALDQNLNIANEATITYEFLARSEQLFTREARLTMSVIRLINRP